MRIRGMLAATLVLGSAAVFPSSGAGAGALDEAILDYRLGHHGDAFRRMAKLADAENPEAMFWVGVLWQRGHGTAQDHAAAYRHYERAAWLGNDNAQNNLALLHRDGLGVPQDKVRAYAWLSLASSRGNTVARGNGDRLRDSMTVDEIRLSQRMVSEYQGRIASIKKPAAIAQSAEMPSDRAPARPRVPSDSDAAEGIALRELDDAASRHPSHPDPAPLVPSSRDFPGDGSTTVVPQEPLARSGVSSTPVSQFMEKPPRHADRDAGLGVRLPAMGSADGEDAASVSAAAPSGEASPAPGAGSVGASSNEKEYVVQLGLFRDSDNVIRMRRKASEAGLTLQEDSIAVAGEKLYRLRVGGFHSYPAARDASQHVNRVFGIRSLVLAMSHG